MAHFFTACRMLPQVVQYHLNTNVFPAVTPAQQVKLSTSGHDLGSGLVWKTVLGFTGTPSEMVPVKLLPVGFEAASEASIFTTLVSKTHVMSTHLPAWTPLSLLTWVAHHPQQFSALIGECQPPSLPMLVSHRSLTVAHHHTACMVGCLQTSAR